MIWDPDRAADDLVPALADPYMSLCPDCGQPGRWGQDDDWCHDSMEQALNCSREGWHDDDRGE